METSYSDPIWEKALELISAAGQRGYLPHLVRADRRPRPRRRGLFGRGRLRLRQGLDRLPVPRAHVRRGISGGRAAARLRHRGVAHSVTHQLRPSACRGAGTAARPAARAVDRRRRARRPDSTAPRAPPAAASGRSRSQVTALPRSGLDRQVHVRHLRHRPVQPLRPRRRPGGGGDPRHAVQPALHLRRRRPRQDPPPPGHRPLRPAQLIPG